MKLSVGERNRGNMAKVYEHAGHRKRLRDKFEKSGFDGWSEDVILEYMLFYAIPRADTHEIARKLLRECGSIRGVMSAPVQLLAGIDGVGKNTAVFIKSLNDFTHYCNNARSGGKMFLTPELTEVYFMDLFKEHKRECLYMICLDAKRAVIRKALINEGAFDASEVDVGRIVRMAVQYDAAGVILAHNHPGGSMEPSGADITTTQIVKNALRLIGVALEDHIIVTDNGVKGFIDVIKHMETEKNIQKYTS